MNAKERKRQYKIKLSKKIKEEETNEREELSSKLNSCNKYEIYGNLRERPQEKDGEKEGEMRENKRGDVTENERIYKSD